MKRMSIAFASVLITTGCAYQPAPEARLGVVGAAATSGSSDAVVAGTLLNVGVDYRSGHNTMVNIEGVSSATQYHNFSVLFGPHDKTYLQNRTPAPGERVAPALAPGVDAEGDEAIGKFTNSEPSWTTNAGYALMWGWWPVGYTPTVRVVTEGRGVVLLLVEKDRERIVRISGAATKVTSPDGAVVHQTIASDMYFVDVTWDSNGNPTYSAPAQVPSGALEEAAKKAIERKGKIAGP